MTIRGMKEPEIDQLVSYMLQSIKIQDDEKAPEKLKIEVVYFCRQFPVPG